MKEKDRDVGKDIQKEMHNSADHWHLQCFPVYPISGIQPPNSGASSTSGMGGKQLVTEASFFI